MLKQWRQRVLAVLAGGCMLFSLNAAADGELSGLSVRAFIDPTTAPFGFVQDDLTKPQGLDVDILYELQRRLGFSFYDDRIFPLMRGQQMELIKRGEADILCGGMSATDERAEFMDYSPIYFDTGMAVMYSKERNPQIKSYRDLAGKKVMAQAASSAETFVRENLPDSEVILINNIILGYFAVAYGQADAVFYDRPILEYFARTMTTLKLAVTEEILGREDSQYAFGFQKGSPYTRYFLQALRDMEYDGTLDRLKEKWGVANAEAE